MPDAKISELPVATAFSGDELFPIVQDGSTVQASVGALASYVSQTTVVGSDVSLALAKATGSSTALTLADHFGGITTALALKAPLAGPTFTGTVTAAAVTVTGAISGSVTAAGSTTARTLAARFADTLNVRDFGATGNGTTDDTAVIQAALTAAAGKTLEVPAGTYLISTGNLTVPTGIRMIGQAGAVLQLGSSSTNSLLVLGSNDDIVIDGLTLRGNRTTQLTDGGSSGISASSGATNITVRNCEITDWSRHGIVLDGVNEAVIENNHVEGTRWGAGILCSSANVSTNVRVTGNRVIGTQQGNIQAYVGVLGWVVTGNYCDGTDLGVTVAGGGEVADNITCYVDDATGTLRNVVIEDNICLNSGNNGIHVGGDDMVIVGNTIYAPRNAGIFCAKSDNTAPDPSAGLVISGNRVRHLTVIDSQQRGIIVRNTKFFSVTGNTLQGTWHGIEINGIDTAGTGCLSGVVSNNTVGDYGTYGIWLRNKVTGTTITDNVLSGEVGASNDIREDLVSATSASNHVYGNQSAGSGSAYAQMFRATSFNVLRFGTDNGEHFRVGSSTASVVNYGTVAGNATGAAVIFGAAGSDTNIDVQMSPKGSGVLKFGTHSAVAAETVTGFITVKDASGTTRKLAVIS